MKQINEYLEKPINESQVYDDIINSLQESKEQGKPIEEGLFTGLFAGAAAFTVGPTIMKAVANVLGIDLKGPLGSLMTSRLILTAVGAKLESWVWNGATAATKAAIAALVPGAGQGSVSAGAQALVAAMPTTLFDSVPATMIYNDSQSKAVPGAGLGDYLKVAGTTVTTANIVAEYVKKYNAIPNDVLVMTGDDAPVIFAPKAHYKLIKSVNRVQGAALQENFVGNSFNDMYFNDVRIIFVDLVGFSVVAQKKNLKLVMDLLSDSSQLIIEKEANASTRRILKLINSMTTWIVKQKYNVLYNG